MMEMIRKSVDFACLDAIEGCLYVIDPDFRLVFVGGAGWSRFALEGGAPELAEPAALLGRNLLDFVIGEDVRKVYRDLIARIAEKPVGPATFEYRCDAPAVRRRNRIAITPLGTDGGPGHFIFQSIVLESVSRPPMNIYDPASIAREFEALGSRPFVTICSFCQNVRWNAAAQAAAEEWVSAETYYQRGGNEQVSVSHGLCPPCLDKFVNQD